MAQARAHGEWPYAAGTRGVQEAGARGSSRLTPAEAPDYGGVQPPVHKVERCGRAGRAPLALAQAIPVSHPYVLALALRPPDPLGPQAGSTCVHVSTAGAPWS